MRDIKFRATAMSGKYVYGNFIHSKRFEGCSNEFRIHEQESGLESDIIIETVGQYTEKKDKNDKEIYEGDIVKTGTDKLMVIGWSVKFASFIISREGWAFAHWFGEAFNSADCEVVGNIHEHPELLKT